MFWNTLTHSNCSFSVRMNRSTHPLHSGWRANEGEERDFGLVIITHVLAAVVVPVADARCRAGVKSAAVVAHSLPQRFQCLEPSGFLDRVQTHALNFRCRLRR